MLINKNKPFPKYFIISKSSRCINLLKTLAYFFYFENSGEKSTE